MNHFTKLTASLELCRELIKLGIEPSGLSLWHFSEEEGKFEVNVMPFGEYDPEISVPAWTKEEIDVMIGGEWSKPDLRSRNLITKAEIPHDIDNVKDYEPVYWVLFLPDVEKKFKNGADASASMLIYALKNRILFPRHCNKRYELFYKN